MDYSVWIEFEHYVDPQDISDGYCNASVHYEDGRTIGFNVWTLECLLENIPTIVEAVEEKGYANFPDLIVKQLTRPQIEEAVKNTLPSLGPQTEAQQRI